MRATRRTTPALPRTHRLPRREGVAPSLRLLPVPAAAPERVERAALLARAGEVLDSGFDFLPGAGHPALADLASLLVPALAAYCRVDLLEEDGALVRAAGAGEAPGGRARLEPGEAHFAARVARTGTVLLLPWLTDSVRRTLRAEAPCLPADAGSLLSVPLLARGRVLGALTLVAGEGRRFDREDLILAQDLGRRTALSLDNLRLVAQAEAVARWRDEALAMVAHDIRSPLHAITLAASALLHGETRAPERGQLSVIAQAAERIRRLASDLLEAGRLEAGCLPVDPEPHSAGALLRGAAAAHRLLAENKGVEIEVEPSAPCLALADADRVGQVLANLVTNAVAHTPAGGRVVLSARPAGCEVVFTVRDTGCGIAPHHLPHVFERFWRGEGSSRGGAGLGLAIVRALVEAHGGSVRAESRPGAGACFTFTLPAAPAWPLRAAA